MLSAISEAYVPIYSLQQASRTGNSRFEAARVNGLTHHQKDLFFVPHRKDFYLLAFARQGNSRHWVDGVPYTVTPDTLYFSAPHQLFLKEDGTIQGSSICFTQEFLDMADAGDMQQLPIIRNPLNGHALSLSPADVAFLEDIFEKLLAEQEQQERLRNSMLSAYLRVLLLYLSRLYTAQFREDGAAADRALLHRFTTLVSQHYTQVHDVAAYAGMLHLSAGHFSELIRKQSGKTPIEHIHDRLLLEAKRMLFHTDASMKEIAFHLGFGEASYFNRFFKRLAGSTPLSYRRAIREMYH